MREAARVLEPGGRFCFTTVHPWNSLKSGEDYFAERTYAETRTRGGLTMTFTDRHRPLSALSHAFEGAGLLIEALREPVPDAAHVAARPVGRAVDAAAGVPRPAGRVRPPAAS